MALNATKWWQTGIIYQIYPRSFMDSNGDGIGDLPGVMQKLDYLEWLGVDAIWFSPTFPSPMKDFGYDVSDYLNVHPDFGTLDDFDRLLKAAHDRNIRVILDLVPNHTSDLHEWFIESRSSKDNPKRDWYIWLDPAPDGGPPNNWQAFFGGSAWEYDEKTGQYYLHSFLKEQPDLNWRNPEVKEAMYNAIIFWLARGVDGFRVDVIDFMIKDEQFRDEPPNPNYDPARDIPREQFLHIYSAYQEGVHELIREMRQIFDEFPGDRVFIGEINYGATIEQMVRFYGADNDAMMVPFNFGSMMMTLNGRVPTPGQVQKYVNAYEAALNSGNQPNWVFGNHDVVRLATRVGMRKRVFAMMTLTLRGTPFVYYGEELGMENVDIPPEKQQDPFGINIPGQGRDGCRTPMQWDASPNAGFCEPDVEPWLPLAPGYEQNNVEALREDPMSMLSLYRQLILFRRSFSALNQGLYYPMPGLPEDVVGYIRQYNDQRIVVLLNFEGQSQQVKLTGYQQGHIILSTELDRDEDVDLSNIELRPYEGVMIEIPAGTQAFNRVSFGEE